MTTEVAKKPAEEKPTANVSADKAENAKVLKIFENWDKKYQ